MEKRDDGMKIYIDSREGKRIVPALSHFKNTDYDVEVKQLPYGDFVCGNAAIEYKATDDLIHSIQSKRIFKQAVNLANNYEHAFIFMESEKVKLQNAIKKSQFVGQKFSWSQYYGAVSSLSQIVVPIVVPNFKQACQLMEKLFIKCNDSKVRTVFTNAKKYDSFLVNSVSSIDGIDKFALPIIDTLELKCFKDLCNVTYDELISVKGIGEKKAEAVMNAIDGGNYG